MTPHELEKWAYINWAAPTNSLETINIEADSNGIINERISFTTLHTTPSVVIKKLSELPPDVTIEVQFASEDIGAYCGEHHFKDGECIHKQENNYQELNQFGLNNDGSPIK
ncbi:hypothetical protein I3271_09225 [Photobacterium leiognathi]|uniref:DUF1281 family ferredoxin-like fold protein n=1 Tax=Photobacterium leiognathi TaxID=553611 RepID=UPI001EE12F95|nr:hypothetical protein [Photobacterium leiognathi]MCG3884870.1 hypothetical protein [Photobacterium leiognathi]